MKLVKEQSAFLLDVCKLIKFATEQGFVVTGGELARTLEMQKIYVQQGKANTMNSMHLKRCAVDLNFFTKKDGRLKLTYDVEILRPIGNYWKSLSPLNSWGGDWVSPQDTPHFERVVR